MSSLKHSLAILLAVIFVGLEAGGAETKEDLLKKVNGAILKAEAEGGASKDAKNQLPYDEAHMSAILLAIRDYFSKPASQALKVKLQFKPDYRDTGDQTRIIRRPARQNPRHRRLGEDYETVEIKKKVEGRSVLKGYVISGGDVARLREIRLVCSALNQSLKDTPLDTPNARRYSPALKSLATLLNSLPKFANKYIEVEGSRPQKHNIRLSEVETMRAELLAIYKHWCAEMAAVKKAAKQDSAR